MTAPPVTRLLNLPAVSAATAWLNAFLASGKNEERPALCRTLSLEFFDSGLHVVGCDGTILFRSWVVEAGHDAEQWPDIAEYPHRSVVVMDPDGFGAGFMRTLITAANSHEHPELVEISLDLEMDEPGEGVPPLGDAFRPQRLVLRSQGQRLDLRLYDGGSRRPRRPGKASRTRSRTRTSNAGTRAGPGRRPAASWQRTRSLAGGHSLARTGALARRRKGKQVCPDHGQWLGDADTCPSCGGRGMSDERSAAEGLGPFAFGRVHQGDMRDLLREIPPGSVDAVVTDPPYSSGGQFRGDRTGSTRSKYVQTGQQVVSADFDGDTRDQRSYARWSEYWLRAAYHRTAPGGLLCVFTDWRQLPTVTDAVQMAGWVWRGIAVWDKTEGVRPMLGRFRAQSEFVVWATKGPAPMVGNTAAGVFRQAPRSDGSDHQTRQAGRGP